ncbi:glycosyltransferase family A protein [Candidatus Margulisiibacteriota bacterium]
MLTIFSLPKSFSGIYKTIQENAISSWHQLKPAPQVILLGDDDGTAEIAAKYKCLHIPQIKRNKAGTPLVNDLFGKAAQKAKFDRLLFVNSDIILDDKLFQAIEKSDQLLITRKLVDKGNPLQSLYISQRWNLKIEKTLNFNDPESFKQLKENVKNLGELYAPTALDIFIFPKHLYQNMPDFSIGWPGATYDNWMIWYAKSQNLPVVDLTEAVTIIHQEHPVRHLTSKLPPKKEAEKHINISLAGGYGYCCDILDSDYKLTKNLDLSKAPLPKNFLFREIKRFIQRIRDYFRFKKYNLFNIF